MTKTEELVDRARRVNPVPRDAFARLAESAEATDILERIVGTNPAVTGRSRADEQKAGTRSRLRVRVLGVAALAAAVAVALTVVDPGIDEPGRRGPRAGSRWSPALVALAERSPRMLLDEKEWRVTRVYEYDSQTGEMEFQNGHDCDVAPVKEGCYWISLNWRPAETHQHYFADRKRGADESSKVTIDGHEADVFAVHDTALGTTYYAVWLDGRHSLELRSDVVPRLAQFNAFAATLHEVDTDAWLSAMPASVVKPDERAAAVDAILEDLPVPSNLDVEALRASQAVKEGYALEDEVHNAVICGWVQQWVDGNRSGDEAAMKEAADTLARADQWIPGRFGAGSFVRDVADGMATNTPVNGDYSRPIGVGFQRHLGCPEK